MNEPSVVVCAKKAQRQHHGGQINHGQSYSLINLPLPHSFHSFSTVQFNEIPLRPWMRSVSTPPCHVLLIALKLLLCCQFVNKSTL